MKGRERFARTMRCEPIGGLVPHFELVFYLTMEAFGKVHPEHRSYYQWNQMSRSEQKAHINDVAQTYISIAKRYHQDAIFITGMVGNSKEDNLELFDTIREKSDDEYFLMQHGGVTHCIPDGGSMLDFSVKMYEDPEALNDISKQNVENMLEYAAFLDRNGHPLDGFGMCEDYCFNTGCFFSDEKFDELIIPYLKAAITGYHEMNYLVFKHTDGNVTPIVKRLAECGPDAIHSLDPQGGVTIPEIRKIVGDDICLFGNVNCGLLQTGSDEACREDVMRALREGMQNGRGYVFCTSNCVYTGMPLERYEMMLELREKYGYYEDYEKNFG